MADRSLYQAAAEPRAHALVSSAHMRKAKASAVAVFLRRACTVRRSALPRSTTAVAEERVAAASSLPSPSTVHELTTCTNDQPDSIPHRGARSGSLPRAKAAIASWIAALPTMTSDPYTTDSSQRIGELSGLARTHACTNASCHARAITTSPTMLVSCWTIDDARTVTASARRSNPARAIDLPKRVMQYVRPCPVTALA